VPRSPRIAFTVEHSALATMSGPEGATDAQILHDHAIRIALDRIGYRLRLHCIVNELFVSAPTG